ncbi:Y-family DNA polymerase [Pseudomonas sp. P66]|uniref:Y-family DNA polymerase n=2 Tax=Pseudomonas arcuscaelestis TaxID=2710591 RepID=A0ABS2BYW5_9PSED|nr:Y-family DNA polymerase [Pseudomonas arcuscaelestis]
MDESFADLSGLPEPLGNFARSIQSRVLQWTGMPVGIGIGHTKTLAKAAQHASKLYRKQTGGVVDLRADHAVRWLLERMPCNEIWGVGRRLTEHLKSEGVTTAWHLASLDPKTVRQRYGVVLERTVRELRGEACIELQEAEPDRQAICTSRMFGSRITTKPAMQEAIASYMHRATQKLRNQKSLTSVFRLGIRTSPFGDEPRYSNATTVTPPYPTDDVLLLTGLASQALDNIWRDGFRYSKAEILLMDLRKRGEYTADLFTPTQSTRSDELMRTIDKINGRFGRNALRSGRMPMAAAWEMRRELMSNAYTTSIHQLMRISAS